MAEQFTSITNCTNHGLQQLLARGFTPQEVTDLLHKPHAIKMQSDGCKVFIRTIQGKSNYVILNQAGEIVTALKELNAKSMMNLQSNYGWVPC